MSSGRRSITRKRRAFLEPFTLIEWDLESLLLYPIVPYPFSVGRRNMPEALSNNRKPKEILGATMTVYGNMKFLIKWDKAKDHVCTMPRCSSREALVCAKKARFICPKLVIAFYQNRIEWGATQEAAEGESECITTLIEKHQLKNLTVKL